MVESIVNIRGLMILLVVIGHACSVFIGDYAGHEQINSIIGAALRNVIYTFHMAVYMGISGYLYFFEVQKCNGKQTADDLIKFSVKKAKRLLVPFLCGMYLWRQPLLLVGKTKNFSDIQGFLREYLIFHTTGALWFLYVLFAIFVVQRLFVNFIWKSDKTILLFLVLFGVMNVVGSRFSGPVHHMMVYNCYFYFGAVVHKYEDKIFCGRARRNWLPASIAISIAVTTLILLQGTFHYPVLLEAVLRLTAGICDMLIAFLVGKIIVSKKFLPFLSDYSMGIYLLHEPIMMVSGYMLPAGWGGVRLTMGLTFIGIVSSIILTMSIRKMHLGFLIGEAR